MGDSNQLVALNRTFLIKSLAKLQRGLRDLSLEGYFDEYLSIFDRFLRNSHQTILVANHEDPSTQFFEFPPIRGHSGVKPPQIGPKYQNRQFSTERADFLRAGIFLHNKKTQPLSFSIFPLKRGHSGVKSPKIRPKFQNCQFSTERADFLRAGIFLHHMKIQPLSFSILTLKRGHSGAKSPQM